MEIIPFQLDFVDPNNNYIWLAPYVFGVIFIGIMFLVFKLFERYYSIQYDKPLVRHYFVYRRLKPDDKAFLRSNFSFYDRLKPRHKKQFEHRVATFISSKNFMGRQDFQLEKSHKLLIAAAGCMLSFGRKNYNYNLIDTVLVYPKEFYSNSNEAYHKGEFNPQHKVIAFSWEDFERGYEITNDNLNLGIHEFMHAMQIEAKVSSDADSARFNKQFRNILRRLTNEDVKSKLEDTRFFRAYAFRNQYEFMAVLSEYFFESPSELRQHFPEIYNYKKKMLNFNFIGY